jgi:hypothetical protein
MIFSARLQAEIHLGYKNMTIAVIAPFDVTAISARLGRANVTTAFRYFFLIAYVSNIPDDLL